MAQFLGLYQLENLYRAQTKFLLVAIAENVELIPQHVLLKPDLIATPREAAAKIQSSIADQKWPTWWPIVLISKSGSDEAEVVIALEAIGMINVFSYRGGWNTLLTGT